jgi:formylglycine-generating enzyme required for sulfatase activity
MNFIKSQILRIVLIIVFIFLALQTFRDLFIIQKEKLNSYMVLIPEGTFSMGSEGIEAYNNEGPVHEVKIDPFYMDIHEVTNAQFLKFVEETGYITTAEKTFIYDNIKKDIPLSVKKGPDTFLERGTLMFKPSNDSISLIDESDWWEWAKDINWRNPIGKGSSYEDYMNHPVVHVSWTDAISYAIWAGKRLPTEAEWEWAAKGGKINSLYPWGNQSINDLPMKANFWQGNFPNDNTIKDKFYFTSPVCYYQSNGYGLYDMAGNVWEWCMDYYDKDTYIYQKINGLCINPTGPKTSINKELPLRVLRGGSFLCNESYCSGYRVTRRTGNSENTSSNHIGFRCAKDID